MKKLILISVFISLLLIGNVLMYLVIKAYYRSNKIRFPYKKWYLSYKKDATLREKLIFHQEENLRLSYELSSAKKRYEIMKEQLGNIEMEKSNITKKIEDLTQSIGNTNIVETPFKVEKDVKEKFFSKENNQETEQNRSTYPP